MRQRICFLLLALTLSACGATPVRVMSFNIRYGTANDAGNSWPFRHELVLETAARFQPDILGVQEALPFQAQFLAQGLPHMTYFGRGRQADAGQGEQCGIFYSEERFELLDAGHFWLSATPDVPGTKSWDSSLSRMATWVLLADSRAPSRTLLFVNTHFDHRGAEARWRGASVLKAWLAEQSATHVVVTGDFNCAEGSRPYSVLVSDDLVDTYRALYPERAENEGTFNGFKGTKSGARIDWILASPSWTVRAATLDDHSLDGRYPSDHFPVSAVLE